VPDGVDVVGFATIELMGCRGGTQNVAIGKLTTGSSFSGVHFPNLITSGDTWSTWVSGRQAKQWLEIDLGISAVVALIKIWWGDENADGYQRVAQREQIKLKDENEHWEQIHRAEMECSALRTDTIPMEYEKAARYIRLEMFASCSVEPDTPEATPYVISAVEVFIGDTCTSPDISLINFSPFSLTKPCQVMPHLF